MECVNMEMLIACIDVMIYFWYSLQKPFFEAYEKGIDGRKAKGGERCEKA